MNDTDVLCRYWFLRHITCDLQQTEPALFYTIQELLTHLLRNENTRQFVSLFYASQYDSRTGLLWCIHAGTNEIQCNQLDCAMMGVSSDYTHNREYLEHSIASRISVILLEIDDSVFYMLRNILVFLFDAHSSLSKTYCSHYHEAAIKVLLNAAYRLGYGELFWLYGYYLMNPTAQSTIIRCSTHSRDRITDLLTEYLNSIGGTTVRVETLYGVFCSRTVWLFRNVVYLLLDAYRYETAVDVYSFMYTSLGIDNRLAYLVRCKDEMPLQYNTFLETIKLRGM